MMRMIVDQRVGVSEAQTTNHHGMCLEILDDNSWQRPGFGIGFLNVCIQIIFYSAQLRPVSTWCLEAATIFTESSPL
jgi:hypothetical protein